MSGPLDLTLPPTAPSVGRYHDQPMEQRPAALYALVDYSEAALQELARACESECEGHEPGSVVRLPPRSLFVGESLRAVFDYHLELGSQGGFDPTLFVVAIDKDWRANGVLLVTLDDDDLECETDKFRLKAQDSGLIIVNLQIGNSDWDESKESYSLDPDGDVNNGDDDDDDDDKDGNDDNDEHDDGNSGSKDDEQTPPDDPGSPDRGPVPPRAATPLGYYIGVYAVAGVDLPRLIRTLEPFAAQKEPHEFSLRMQAVLPADSGTDPISAAMALHPARCATNRWLHKFLFLVADTPDPYSDGLALVSLGGTAGRKAKDRKTFPARASQRVECSAEAAVQDAVCTMALGARSWLPPDGPALGAFRSPAAGGSDAARLLDPAWDRRAQGEEIIIWAPGYEHADGMLQEIKYSLPEALRRWSRFCFERRFRSGLSRKYFIYVDSADAEKDGVLLVKVDWDGDVGRGKEEVQSVNLEGKEETWRVDAKTAYGTLKDVIEGKAAWEGKT